MSNFETATEIVGKKAIVKVSGYLSGQGGEELEQEVERLLAGGSRSMVINFRETNMVNSVGISILISIIEKARSLAE